MKAVGTFVVLGAGAWGSALALHLARQGHSVVLWGHDADKMVALARTRYLSDCFPDVIFPDNIRVTYQLETAFAWGGEAAVVLIVVPSVAFEEVTRHIAPYLKPGTPILWGTKGLSPTGDWLSKVCEKNTGVRPMGVLSGPSFAREVAQGLPTAMTLAMETEEGEVLQRAIHSERMRIYLSTDLVGVQLGGVLKNIIAIAAGLSDGLGYGANARCALITRGLAELMRLGQAVGAQSATFMGLSGVGDMVLTCTDNQSRNRRFGMALGEGKSVQQAIQRVGKVVEGKENVRQALSLAQRHQVELPLCEQVHAVLFQEITPQEAVEHLLLRAPKAE